MLHLLAVIGGCFHRNECGRLGAECRIAWLKSQVNLSRLVQLPCCHLFLVTSPYHPRTGRSEAPFSHQYPFSCSMSLGIGPLAQKLPNLKFLVPSLPQVPIFLARIIVSSSSVWARRARHCLFCEPCFEVLSRVRSSNPGSRTLPSRPPWPSLACSPRSTLLEVFNYLNAIEVSTMISLDLLP